MIVELYAVAWQYRDRDNRDAETEPFTPWFLDQEKAQVICDEKNAVKIEELRKKNAKEALHVAMEHKKYDLLVAAGLQEPYEYEGDWKPFVQTALDEPAVLVYAELENGE